MSVSVNSSFHRSVNLARDFYHAGGLRGYTITSKSLELISRLVEHKDSSSGIGGAWSITGPYGGGKSSFALFIAHLFHGNAVAHSKLAKSDAMLLEKFDAVCNGIYCPVLVVGSREPLSVALIRGLIDGASFFLSSYARHPGNPSRKTKLCRTTLLEIIQEAKEYLSSDINDDVILDLYQRTAATVHAATTGGLILIIDELGKLLEYASLYPDRTDLYVLQRLAERASRSGITSDMAAPMPIFIISHQAFDRYAGRLSASERDEWRKVQGRFEDFAFVEPINETSRLLAQAIHVNDSDRLPNDGIEVIDQLLSTATLRPEIEHANINQHLAKALPLHPAVSLIVGPLFRRLAQNERSLFAFLSSGEPNCFLDLYTNGILDTNSSSTLGDTTEGPLPYYRLDHLYDYIVGSVGTVLFSEHMGKLWAETESVLAQIQTQDELAVRCIKQIAVLNFAGSLAGLSSSSAVLRATVDAPLNDVDSVLEYLKTSQLITYRSFKKEYHIWQGSDFNIDAALQEASDHIPPRTSLAQLLTSVLPPTPLVARRHSFRTGTTRVFEVHYASSETWHEHLIDPPLRSDGHIIYVIPDHEGDKKTLLSLIQKSSKNPLILLGIPDGVSRLHEIVHKLACLEWISNNADKLHGDEVARREIHQQLADLSGYVEQRLMSLLAPDAEGLDPCTWVHQGEIFRLNSGRSIQEKLSQICDDVFCETPLIWNELVNRHKPSPSAVKGMKLLLHAMLEYGTANRLGIQKNPAEYGMYVSVLHSTGIHRQSDDKSQIWHFSRPNSTGCLSVWDKIIGTLHVATGRRVSVQKLYDQLRLPPYGMRVGLMPIFVFAIYKSVEDEIAVYENGRFITNFEFETIERFLKNPDNFELQLVQIEGGRAELLRHLASYIGFSKSSQLLLPIVLHILKRIHNLPPYARKTSLLSPMALKVRESLNQAVEPTTLLFEDLPIACGSNSFLANNEVSQTEVQSVAKNLQEALRELSEAYDVLLDSLQMEIASVFRLRSKTSNDQRRELTERAQGILPHASDTKLKAFLVRATDEVLSTRGWYESLASLFVRRPPTQWRDEDLPIFSNAIREVARRFNTLEAIAFEIEREHGSTEINTSPIERVRLSITMQYKNEIEQVISIHPEDDKLIDQVYQRLNKEIDNDEVAIETKIAALAKISHKLLIQREELIRSNE